MKVTIFLISFGRDLPWAERCLRSIKKFASGFHAVSVLVPTRDEAAFFAVCEKNGATLFTFDEAKDKGFNHHQALICCGDLYAQGADFVLHVDSDCAFLEPVTPEDYFVDGKPVLVIASYERLRQLQSPSAQWQYHTERALGFHCPYETMCRHPAVHPVETYPALRECMEANHKIPFLTYVLNQKNSFPQGFSDFNAVGAFAWEKKRDLYHWVDFETPVKNKLFASWSHYIYRDPARAHEILADLDRMIDGVQKKPTTVRA